MLDQNTFIETVQSVAEIIRTSAEPIGRDEIMSYFKDMELNKAQEDMYLNFSSHRMSRRMRVQAIMRMNHMRTNYMDESSENAALNNVIYSEGDSMDAIAGGKNNKAKQDNEAEPDIDEDSLSRIHLCLGCILRSLKRYLITQRPSRTICTKSCLQVMRV